LFVKRLDMHGFKSFADKTSLQLTEGITVVVGPNGCGKSNITDAIRWVFGEQSARHLRGTRMDDIIFGGTSSRKPLSFAEVSVTLDHSDGMLGIDYSEITVTRRIYRNGESEYLLNKRPCRLKDIVELFLDTGIGKEAYSFMGQGRVDELLNARPEERRQIFEEAAGILKYKSRKREAERRLAETAENLLRVGDIIHELSAQLEPLSGQAKTAQRFLTLRGDLKKQEVDLSVHDASKLRERWYDLDQQALKAADELLERQTAIGKLENQLTDKQLFLDEEQSAVTLVQRDAQQCTAELEKLQGKMAVTREKIIGTERQAANANLALAELDTGDEALEAECRRITELLKELEINLDKARDNLNTAERELAAMDTSPEALRSHACTEELEALLPETRRLQNDLDRLEIETEQFTARLLRLQTEEAGKAEARLVLGEKTERLYAEEQDFAKLLTGIVQQQVELREQRNRFIQTQSALAAKRDAGEKKLSDILSRIRLLSELDEAMSGYFHGVKTVLAAKKQDNNIFPGVLGTVADMVDVPPEYVSAVEAALGPALQNLIAVDDSVAKEAITYLKKIKGGRATFLPLNLIDSPPRRNVPPELSSQPGYIGVAADLINTSARFRPIVESLLSRVHVVRDLNATVPAAKSLQFRERVVSLEGDVILPGGAITGGTEKKPAGVLSRRKEADSLKKEESQQRERLISFEKEQTEINTELAAIDKELTEYEEKARSLEVTQSVKQNEYRFLQEQAVVLDKELAAFSREAGELSKAEEIRSAAMLTVKDKWERNQEQERNLRYEQAKLSGVLSAREQEKRSLRERYTDYRVRLASLQQQRRHLEEEMERLRNEQTALKGRRHGKETEIKELQTALLVLQGTLEEGKEEVSAVEEKRSIMLAGLLEREKALREATTAFREETEELRQQEKTLTSLERRMARQEVDRGKVETELDAVLTRLRESWELEFEDAQKIAAPLTDREAVRASISTLKEEMQALGTVNLGAIDEYKRVAERVEFLTVQRADLQEGEKDLQRIIQEIDGRMGEKFSTSFAVINESFGVVFKELFGGGRAYLRLTDPENPLESGIEMIAQPPGKKLQHLSLLSGGEKALTAIALLFAFLKVKPTPFCVLDEIEAALDETNLAKFNKFLQSLRGQTQFIIISHRKKTMEQADILYGVTMEESGISKLISVKLRDEKEPSEAAG